MKRKRIRLLGTILALSSILSISFVFSANYPWKQVDKDSYKLMRAGDGKFLAFRTLQDKDKADIVSAITEKSENGDIVKENWKDIRKEILLSLSRVKGLGTNDMFEPTEKEQFEVSYDDIQGSKS